MFIPASPVNHDILSVPKYALHLPNSSTPNDAFKGNYNANMCYNEVNHVCDAKKTAQSPGKIDSLELNECFRLISGQIFHSDLEHSVKDILSSLDVDAPFVEYLVMHGALTEQGADSILAADGEKRKNLLLQAICSAHNVDHSTNSSTSSSITRSPWFALFLNALRHTGQHSLASILDCGRRIVPSPSAKHFMVSDLDDTCMPGRRLRGQVSLWIQLHAIKIDPGMYADLLSIDNGSNTGLPPFSHRLSSEPPPGQSVWINQNQQSFPTPPVSQTHEQPRKKRHRLANWLSKIRRLFTPSKKHKTRKKPKRLDDAPQPNDPSTHTVPVPSTNGVHASAHVRGEGSNNNNIQANSKQDSRSAKLMVLDEKSSEFCDLLLDRESSLHDVLVKYLEQTCGVLFLCSHLANLHSSGISLHITVIATKPDVVQRLSDFCLPSVDQSKSLGSACRFTETLSRQLIKAGLLTSLNVQDIRLRCQVEPEELSSALRELTNDMD